MKEWDHISGSLYLEQIFLKNYIKSINNKIHKFSKALTKNIDYHIYHQTASG